MKIYSTLAFATFLLMAIATGATDAEAIETYNRVSSYEKACEEDRGSPCPDFELLQFAIDAAASVGAELYIDGQFIIGDTLLLRKASTLRGDGPNGGPLGTILFDSESPNRSMFSIEGSGKSDIVLTDLYLENIGDQGPVAAFDLSRHSFVYLDRLQIANFDIGLFGDESLSIWVENCVIRNSKVAGLYLTQRSNAWRVRSGVISQSAAFGVVISESRDVLLDGVRMESNQFAAVWTDSDQTKLTNNYFEGNGGDARTAVFIAPEATDAQLFSNYLATNGTPSPADDQLIRDRGRRTTQLQARRDFVWPDDARFGGSLLLERANDQSPRSLAFTGRSNAWALRHQVSGDLEFLFFDNPNQAATATPLRFDHVSGSVVIGDSLQVSESGPKICGGQGSPPNAASAPCDRSNGSFYLDGGGDGSAYLHVAGRWKKVNIED